MDQVLAKVASFDATGLLEKLKDILLVEKVINRLQEYWGLIPQGVFEFCAKYERYMLIFAVCLLALLAFEGHKIF